MRIRKASIVLVLFLGNFQASYAEYAPCTESDGKHIRPKWISELKTKRKITKLFVDDCVPGFYGQMASSLLVSGKAPKYRINKKAIVELTAAMRSGDLKSENKSLQQDITGALKFEEWSCRYSPLNAWDQNSRTAWCEGMRGAGIGEIIIVPLTPGKEIEIWAGYGKTAKIFKENNRPKDIRIYYLYSKNYGGGQCGGEYHDLKVLKTVDIQLQDLNQYQKIKLPITKVSPQLLAFEILSIYSGSKYNDTCFTDIR